MKLGESERGPDWKNRRREKRCGEERTHPLFRNKGRATRNFEKPLGGRGLLQAQRAAFENEKVHKDGNGCG